MPSTACSLAALGMINSLGNGMNEIWPRLIGGDQSSLVPRSGYVKDRELFLGEVGTALPVIPSRLSNYDCRNNALTLAAYLQIEDQVQSVLNEVGADRLGVVMGTSTSGSGDAEKAIFTSYEQGALPDDFAYVQLEFGGTSGFLSEYLKLTGPSFSISTACSSSARALASARSLLALDLCDAVLAGGTDSLCLLTTNGFSTLQAVSDQKSNPFSQNRNGLSLGEGSALFLVTRDGEGIQLLGVGESSEAHHMSAPDPEGRGAEASMRGALDDAGLDSGEISYLNLHGTGTQLNDAMEAKAVDRIFGKSVPCSSTKSMVGHTLGAAGAMELGFCWAALNHREGNVLPLIPHCFDGVQDPELPELDLIEAARGGAPVEKPRLMTNSFGFGGNNCTLVLGESQ